jgi:putative restriction endonuclease
MFAGFDIARHKTFTTGSPSVQIDITSLRQALQHGLSFHRKVNDEIAVAIRPDQFLGYVRNASQLHLSGRSLPTVKVLKKVASLEAVSPQEIESLSKTRQRLIQAVSRLSRSANFREQVLRAYDHRCAVTRMQLRLVEAAHILPVAAPRSPDHVTNGIALSPTYHRAFDRGLIFLDDSYTMRVNPRKQDELSSLHLDGGLEAFIAPLGEISLPPDRQQWPKSQFINNANRFRGIPV